MLLPDSIVDGVIYWAFKNFLTVLLRILVLFVSWIIHPHPKPGAH